MIHLLIVDDEHPAVEGLLRAVDWHALGIDTPSTADSAEQAAELLIRTPIDIVICDIRMPGKSGLELMQEASYTVPETVWIFLSAYAEFDYAQHALALGAVRYLLKPCAPRTLLEAVTAAIERLAASRKRNQAEDRTSQDAQKIREIDQLWRDILHRRVPNNQEAIYRVSLERGIPTLTDWQFCPVLFSCAQEKIASLSTEVVGGIKDEIRQTLLYNELLPIVFEYEDRLIALLHLFRSASLSAEELAGLCESVIDHCQSRFQTALFCNMGEFTYSDGVAQTVRTLIAASWENILGESRVFPWDRCPMPLETLDYPDPALIKDSFAGGRYFQALDYLLQSARQQALTGRLSAATIKLFQQDYLHIIYSYLNDIGEDAHAFMNTHAASTLLQSPARQMENMTRWLEDVTGCLMEYLDSKKNKVESDQAVQQAITYIRTHLDEPLTRNAIATKVFLNPDYFGRVFYKETGVFISDFIMRERIQKAQRLLDTTTKPIGFIAAKVGFSNFSYFSKQFKKLVGMHPSEYRRHADV